MAWYDWIFFWKSNERRIAKELARQESLKRRSPSVRRKETDKDQVKKEINRVLKLKEKIEEIRRFCEKGALVWSETSSPAEGEYYVGATISKLEKILEEKPPKYPNDFKAQIQELIRELRELKKDTRKENAMRLGGVANALYNLSIEIKS